MDLHFNDVAQYLCEKGLNDGTYLFGLLKHYLTSLLSAEVIGS